MTVPQRAPLPPRDDRLEAVEEQQQHAVGSEARRSATCRAPATSGSCISPKVSTTTSAAPGAPGSAGAAAQPRSAKSPSQDPPCGEPNSTTAPGLRQPRPVVHASDRVGAPGRAGPAARRPAARRCRCRRRSAGPGRRPGTATSRGGATGRVPARREREVVRGRHRTEVEHRVVRRAPGPAGAARRAPHRLVRRFAHRAAPGASAGVTGSGACACRRRSSRGCWCSSRAAPRRARLLHPHLRRGRCAASTGSILTPSCRTRSPARPEASCAACTGGVAGARPSWCGALMERSTTWWSTRVRSRRPSGSGSRPCSTTWTSGTSTCLAGFLHGHQTLTPTSDVCYRIDREHTPGEDLSAHYADPDLAVEWPDPVTLVSERDDAAGPWAHLASLLRDG